MAPSDDYDWLYDPGTKKRPTPPADDATRAFGPETQASFGAPDSGAPAASQPPPPQLPPPGSGDFDPPKKKKKHPIRRTIITVLVLWLAFLIAVPMIAWGKITKVDATPDGDRPAKQPGTTFLLVGSDARPKEKNRGRTDSIMLLTYGSGPSVLTSIPRDSIVDIPGHGTTKINAANVYGGPELLVETLEKNTGVRIDGYVEIGFTGLTDVVDAVGGVELCPKEDLSDKDSKLDIKAGCQTVDGETALAYSRNRKSFAAGDIARGENQREVIGAIGSAARSPMTLLNPVRYWQTASTAAQSVAIGDNVGPIMLGRFALNLTGAMSSGKSCTVPIADMSVRWDAARASEYFGLIAKGKTDQLGDLCSADGMR